ncbi:unnamed protein product [Caretta caretta]
MVPAGPVRKEGGRTSGSRRRCCPPGPTFTLIIGANSTGDGGLTARRLSPMAVTRIGMEATHRMLTTILPTLQTAEHVTLPGPSNTQMPTAVPE